MAALVHLTGVASHIKGDIKPQTEFLGDPQGGITPGAAGSCSGPGPGRASRVPRLGARAAAAAFARDGSRDIGVQHRAGDLRELRRVPDRRALPERRRSLRSTCLTQSASGNEGGLLCARHRRGHVGRARGHPPARSRDTHRDRREERQRGWHLVREHLPGLSCRQPQPHVSSVRVPARSSSSRWFRSRRQRSRSSSALHRG